MFTSRIYSRAMNRATIKQTEPPSYAEYKLGVLESKWSQPESEGLTEPVLYRSEAAPAIIDWEPLGGLEPARDKTAITV